MKNKILGVIGVIWGGLILVNGLLPNDSSGSEAYQTGSLIALSFGALLLGFGIFYLFRKPSKSDEEKTKRGGTH